jgi:hypothetical protein
MKCEEFLWVPLLARIIGLKGDEMTGGVKKKA